MTVQDSPLFRPQMSRAARLCAALPVGGTLTFRVLQLIDRIFWPNHVARTAFGARVTCDTRDLVQRCIRHFGLWEPNITDLFARYVRPGDTVVDVGANIGYFSLLASRLVGPTGRVVAIEASPTIAERLRANLAMNEAANVRVANVAVSDREGEVVLYEGPRANSGETTIIAGRLDGSSRSVQALPLDRILSEEEARAATFMKIDVEGAEGPVLFRLLDCLGSYPRLRRIVVEASVAEAPELWGALFKRMAEAGFSASRVSNQYDYGFYLFWAAPAAPVPMRETPVEDADILYTRAMPSDI